MMDEVKLIAVWMIRTYRYGSIAVIDATPTNIGEKLLSSRQGMVIDSLGRYQVILASNTSILIDLSMSIKYCLILKF